MKRLMAFITGFFITGIMYVNALSDTIPFGMENYPSKKQPVQGTMDTMPPNKWDTSQNKLALDTSLKMKNDTIPNRRDTSASGGQTDTATKKLPDRLLMKNDQMWIVKDGVEIKMEKDYVFKSGTVVTVDGTMKKKDGTSTKLKNGQYIALPSEKDKKPGE